jgi:hypothetical protein
MQLKQKINIDLELFVQHLFRKILKSDLHNADNVLYFYCIITVIVCTGSNLLIESITLCFSQINKTIIAMQTDKELVERNYTSISKQRKSLKLFSNIPNDLFMSQQPWYSN